MCEQVCKNNYLPDVWNSWTEKSKETPFKSETKFLGDGEEKLGKEYDVKPLGQNSPYDLKMNFGEKWEVKKPDGDNSFRIGVEISKDYTPIMHNVYSMFREIVKIKEDLSSEEELDKIIKSITEKNKRCKTSLLSGLCKHEVSSSNLIKANNIIEKLKELISDINKISVELYCSFSGKKKKYNILKSYQKLMLEDIEISQIVKIFGDKKIYNKVVIYNAVSKHIQMFENKSLIDKLNEIVRNLFISRTLVLVHKEKGYMPIKKLNKIICNRITSGNPRCKFL